MTDAVTLLKPDGTIILRPTGKTTIGSEGDSCCCGVGGDFKQARYCANNELAYLRMADFEVATITSPFLYGGVCYYFTGADNTSDETIPRINADNVVMFDDCEACQTFVDSFPVSCCRTLGENWCVSAPARARFTIIGQSRCAEQPTSASTTLKFINCNDGQPLFGTPLNNVVLRPKFFKFWGSHQATMGYAEPNDVPYDWSYGTNVVGPWVSGSYPNFSFSVPSSSGVSKCGPFDFGPSTISGTITIFNNPCCYASGLDSCGYRQGDGACFVTEEEI